MSPACKTTSALFSFASDSICFKEVAKFSPKSPTAIAKKKLIR